MSTALARCAWYLCLLGALACGGACASDVHVMISAGFYGAYAELAPAFERATGHHLVTTRGPSVGDSPESIPTRLAKGETADVLILDDASADALIVRGLAQAGSKVEFARSQIGMAVREGVPKPDIGSVDAFRSVLLAAKSIAYSDSTSGAYLASTLFVKLGVAEQVAGKSRKVRGPPSGEPVAAVVARGEAEIGFQQVSELMHVPGVTLVGPIPAELQPRFAYSGAIATSVKEPDAARALIRFIASPDAAATITKAGLAPVAADGHAAPGRIAVLSLMGDSLTVVAHHPETGSRVDRNDKETVAVPPAAFDEAALMGVRDALSREASAESASLVRSAGLRIDAQHLLDNETFTPTPELSAALAQSGAQRLVLLTRRLAPAQLRLSQASTGSGQLEGIGFYVDGSLRTRRKDGEKGVGFLAAYAYYDVYLIDVASSRVLGHHAVEASSTRSAAQADDGQPWDAMTADQKVRVLRAIIRRQTAKALAAIAGNHD